MKRHIILFFLISLTVTSLLVYHTISAVNSPCPKDCVCKDTGYPPWDKKNPTTYYCDLPWHTCYCPYEYTTTTTTVRPTTTTTTVRPTTTTTTVRPTTTISTTTTVRPTTTTISTTTTIHSGIVPYNDMNINENTFLEPNMYKIEDNNGNGIIIIDSDGMPGNPLILDCQGAIIKSPEYDNKKPSNIYQGIGILVNGHKNVEIRNCNIHGYKYGIKVENSKNIKIINNDFSNNQENANEEECDRFAREIWNIEPSEVNYAPWRKRCADYHLSLNCLSDTGGGIFLENTHYSEIRENEVNEQGFGISLRESNNNIIENNNANYNSFVGLHLKGSSKNEIRNNHFDYSAFFCGEPSPGKIGSDKTIFERVGHCDSAGVIIIDGDSGGSNNNIIENNSFIYGGDGFFLKIANREPSNNNLVLYNNASYSPHNAFESTFSKDNIFKYNDASFSNYGFWLGYSSYNKLIGNTIQGNIVDGIAIEHGHHNIILENNIIENKMNGIHLWTDSDEGQTEKYSYNYTIKRNIISNNIVNIKLIGTTNSIIKENIIRNSGIGIFLDQANLEGEVVNSVKNTIIYNNFYCTVPSHENLALNKPTDSNKLPQNSHRAVDGDKTDGLEKEFSQTYWNPGLLNPDDWWEVDLGENKEIQTVIIYPYVRNFGDWLNKFHIEISDTGRFRGEEKTIITEADFPIESYKIYHFPIIETRYIRIVSDEKKDWTGLQEFEVFSEYDVTPYYCSYSFYNNQPSNVNAKNNNWGTRDRSQIDDKIYDNNDDSNLGQVYYSSYLLSSYCIDNSYCEDTDCDYLDGCRDGGKYYNCHDVNNNCLKFRCSSNTCLSYTSCYKTGIDFDRDGWDIECGDCDDFDPQIYPGAPENIIDQKDNDCDGIIDEGCGSKWDCYKCISNCRADLYTCRWSTGEGFCDWTKKTSFNVWKNECCN